MSPTLVRAMKVAVAAACLLAAGWMQNAELLRAQTWEYLYGSTTRSENGKFRVIPVAQTCNCITGVPTDGYIAVGTSYPASSDPQSADVHVVRVDNNGARIWEYTYDITGNNDWDDAWSIIELSDGSGFAITGETFYDGSNDVDLFLLKIDCYGAVLWAKTYGAVDIVDGGRDLIEATTGNAAAGTSAGDIIVAGVSLGPGPFAGTPNGYLLRTTANGTIIWDGLYHYQPGLPPGEHVYFHSLTEATLTSGTGTADIVGVGFTAPFGLPTWMQAIAVRVNGDNGTIGLAPQGAGIYGSVNNLDQFWSVIELRYTGQGNAGHIVASGDYGTGAAYAVKLNGGDPTVAPVVERTYTSTVGNALLGRTIREITFAPGTGSVNRGQLVMTGTEIQPTGSNEMILFSIGPGTLPVAGLTTKYGGGLSNEEGWSVYPVDAVGGRTFGFVLCGRSSMNADDMYLVKTDGFGATHDNCEESLGITSTSVSTHTAITMTVYTMGLDADRNAVKTCRQWGAAICPWPTCVGCSIHPLKGDGPAPDNRAKGGVPGLFEHPVLKGNEYAIALEAAAARKGNDDLPAVLPGASFTVYPNPVKAGTPVRIAVAGAAEIHVMVSNTAGKIILPETVPERNEGGELVVRTAGWPSGVYLINLVGEGSQSSVRVVVTE